MPAKEPAFAQATAAPSTRTLTFRQWEAQVPSINGAKLALMSGGNGVYLASANGEPLSEALTEKQVHALLIAFREGHVVRVVL